MAVSKIHTVACLHPSSRPSLSSPHIQINTFASESFITVDNPPDITAFGQIRQRYNFSRCVTQPEQCKPEVEDLVQKALEGYNSAAIFMSTGPLDPFSSRQTIIHQLLSHLDEQLNYLNDSNKRDRKRSIRLDYAFLGFDNDNCYDLQADRKLKKQYIDENGMDTIMRRVNNGDDIWKNTKEGSRMPFVLKIRLSDGHHFLGTLTIIDLLFPWSQPSAIDDQSFAFQELVQVLNDYADLDFEGSINNSTNHLLTKIAAECFCGPCKTAVFAYVNEYPDNVLRDTIDALELMQTVRRIRTVTIRNTVDSRTRDMYKQQLSTLQRKHEVLHNRASNLEAELDNAVQQLNVKDMDLHRVEVTEARVRHESEETMKTMKDQLEKMERSLELERLKSAYDESKHNTKAILLDGRILRLKSRLFCANYTSMKHQDDLQDAYARIQRDGEVMQEQLSVIQQQNMTIQDMKDETTAAGAEKEHLTQAIKSLNDQIEQKQNELDSKKSILEKKLNTIRRQKEALQQAKQRLDEQDEILGTRESAIRMKDEHITKLRELVARKQKKHSRQEQSVIDEKELNDLKMLVETLKSELGEAEDDKKALEKAIDEAEEHAKRQEKTLKAQERALAKAEKRQSGSKNHQNEIKQLENEKLNIMTKLSHMTNETNAMQERIRELELENRHLMNDLSKVPDTFYSSSDIVRKHAVEESKAPMVDLPLEYRQQPAAQPTQQRPNNSMNEDTTMIDVTGAQEEQEKQQHNNAAHMTNEASAEYAGVETRTTTTNGSTKNSPRKPRQTKQQRNNSKVTERRRTPRHKQQPTSSPEPTFPSGADQSPVLEYLGNDFEPVLQLPNVDNNDDAPPVPEKMKIIDNLQDNHQYNVAVTSQPDTVDTQQFDQVNNQQTSHHGDTQSNVAATSQPDTVDTQQFDRLNTRQTSHQDDIQFNIASPSQSDTVDTQQSEAMSTQQSDDHQSKPRRQTRKRRRLVDPKKRMAEDYEGDLSPLAKVNRIIQQSGDE